MKLSLKFFRLMMMALLVATAWSCSSDSNDEPTTPTKPTTPTTAVEYMTFNKTTTNDITCDYDSASKVYTFLTTGSDPYIFMTNLKKTLPDDSCVITFQYQCPKGTDELQFFFGNPISEDRSKKTTGLSSQTSWTTYSLPIKDLRKSFNWGNIGNVLRMDFGNNSGVTIKIKNFYYRAMTQAEKDAYDKEHAAEEAKEKMAANLQDYLSKDYASSVTSVTVTDNQVTIKGTCSGSGKFALAEITPYEDVTELTSFPYQTEITDKNFTITLDRTVKRINYQYDRVLSKWAIIEKGTNSDALASHARYADEVTPKYSASKMTLKNKKGLGGFSAASSHADDLDALGIGSVTVNVVANELISLRAWSSDMTYVYGGITYHINKSALNNYDNTFNYCYRRGIITSAIILITPTSADDMMTSIFKDPEYTSGYFTMPNMTTATGVNAYAAILDFLANRYSTGSYGRINNWIMHNEVDYGVDWTNMGEQPELRYLDRYVKSMRMCYNIVRQYDQNAAILGSYTHNWATGDNGGYAPKTMLEQTEQYSKIEGDFWWGVAYHPYPQDLTAPAFWKNDSESTYSLSSHYCTFKNLEVISTWIQQSSILYQGKTKRTLFLSENGTNSPSYSTSDLALQAAGGCWAWKKVNKLSGIDAMQWHNWQDNRAEFGLRIGLRYYSDTNDGGPKPVWYVWQAGGTDKEDAVFNPYLKTIGIANWDAIFHNM